MSRRDRNGVSLPLAPGGEWVACWSAKPPDANDDNLPVDPSHQSGWHLSLRGATDSVRVHLARDGAAIVDGVVYLDDTPADARQLWETYRDHGERSFRFLRGVFLLIVWDRRTNRLLVVRDPIGLHPCFHATTSDSLLVSGSLRALRGQPDVSSAVNFPAIADQLRQRWPDVEETPFVGIRRVAPGHVLEHDGRGARMQRFWSATRGRWVDWATRDEVSRFDGLLDQAVARCLLPGRAGVFLSGGLDSVSVAAVASDLAAKGEGPPVTALSLAFPTPETDEVSIQRAVAEALGMEQRMVPFAEAAGLRGILQESLALSAAWPVPLLNLWLPAYLELGRRGREVGCTALLTGGGGDEWLSVTPYLAADLLRDLDLAGLARLHRQFVRSYDRPRLALLRANLWTFGLRPLLRETATQWTRLGVPRLNRWRRRRAIERNWPEWLAPDPRFRKLLVERELADEPATPRSFYVDQMRSAFDHPVVCVEMEEVFETGRRLGAFMFQPYWDADLVEFLFRVPPTLLNRDDRAKGIVRPLLEKRFPSLGFHRHKKREATTLVDHLVATEGLTAWQTLGGPAALADAGIVDFSKLQATMNQALHARPIQRAAFVWHAATLESWLRRHA